jgi:quercetin dioxygenase-like cupin family protein
MEILRFGPGHRHARTLSGTQGLAHQTIWADPRARVTELAFSRRALVPPQTSPDAGLFIVVAGGGWVQVGDERASINHGEAVEWPAGVAHGAWTDGSTMRALLLEVPDLAIEAPRAARAEPARVTDLEPARGHLAERERRPEDHDSSEGEPW